jgi:hypothetical protein
MVVAAVILLSVVFPPALVLYGESVASALLGGVGEIEYRIAWMVATQVSLLACWLMLRARLFAATVLWSGAALLSYRVALELLLRFLTIGRFVDWSSDTTNESIAVFSLYMLLSYCLAAIGLLAWRELWWRPSVAKEGRLPARNVFSLRRLQAWMAACVCFVWVIRAICLLERATVFEDIHVAAVLGFMTSCYAVLVVSWLAPRGWIAKVLGLPLVCATIAGLVYLEAILLEQYLSSIWQVAVAMAVLIAVSVYHAITVLLMLLPLRMVSVFAVDSVLGGECLDQKAATWVITRWRSWRPDRHVMDAGKGGPDSKADRNLGNDAVHGVT